MNLSNYSSWINDIFFLLERIGVLKPIRPRPIAYIYQIVLRD
jgi:hypothetical protein